MTEGIGRQKASARCALDKALLQKIRLDDILDGVARLRKGGGDRLDADRAAPEIQRDEVEICLLYTSPSPRD
mgnify:CR=1 FL=1